MSDQTLINSIKERLEKGSSPEITKAVILAGGGYTEKEIDEAFKEVGASVVSAGGSPVLSHIQLSKVIAPPPPPPPEPLPYSNEPRNYKKIVILTILLLILAAVGYLYINNTEMFDPILTEAGPWLEKVRPWIEIGKQAFLGIGQLVVQQALQFTDSFR